MQGEGPAAHERHGVAGQVPGQGEAANPGQVCLHLRDCVLVDDKDFFDVTIACDDEQLQVHKVIISACSPFFRNILRRSPDQHPLLFLKVVKYNVLYVHHGEVNIA